MKLKLIGTGSIAATERSACSLIDEKILIDCGNGNVKTLVEQGVDVNSIEAILITHLHTDHFFDLPFFILLKNFNNSQTITKIYCPKGTEKIIEHLCNDYVAGQANVFEKWKNNAKVEFIEFDTLKNKEVVTGYYTNSYLVEHGDLKPAYGYIIRKENKAIGFSGDSTYCENINVIVKNSDIAVLDMSFPEKNKTHMGVGDIENISNIFNKKIVATHMGIQARKLAKEKKIKNLIIPSDGEEIEI